MECCFNTIIKKNYKKNNYKNNNNSAENSFFNRMMCHQQNRFDNRYDNITAMVIKHNYIVTISWFLEWYYK